MLSHKLCERASTFEVKATLMGDLNEWMSITLDDEHASAADVKEGVEQAKGIAPAMQELFRYHDTWTGTEGSGGSGHSAAQEAAACVENSFVFEDCCSVLVSVNENFHLVLEGQEAKKGKEGSDLGHAMMGVYQRMEGKEMNGRGVWQAQGNIERFLFYAASDTDCSRWWVGTSRQHMEAGAAKGVMMVDSMAITPDRITETWWAVDTSSGAWSPAPKFRARVCSCVEQHAAAQCLEQEQVRALAQAQQVQQLVIEGLADLVGVYELVKGKVVNGRAVWQCLDEGEQRFLYFANTSEWFVSDQGDMEAGSATGFMSIATAALTPDQAHPSELWQAYDGEESEEVAGVRVRAVK
jgi:hypothetical protein